ncbi:MAG: ATP-binding cassette domain-containing protein [Nitrososphaerota archaeon]
MEKGLEQNAVELDSVSTYYYGEKRPALRDVTLRIPAGSLALIVGPNGAGKTTLLETILGLLRPRSGRIKVLGYSIPAEASKARALSSYLPQDFMKPPIEPFTAREVVAMGLASSSFSGRLLESGWKKVDRALELLGMMDHADKPFGKLSGGQQQKVLLARAIVREPKLLLLDEPFSAIDLETRSYIVGEIFPGLLRGGCTILLVSHDLDYSSMDADMIIRVVDGRVSQVIMRGAHAAH